MPPDLFCAGDACVDVYLSPEPRCYCGGNAVNVAVALASALAEPVSLLSALGDDPQAALFHAALAAKGLDLRFLQTVHGPTARSHTRLDAQRRPEFLHALNPPRPTFALQREARALLPQARLVTSTALRPNLDELRLAAAGRPLICVDYGRRPDEAFQRESLPLATVAVRSLPEEDARYGAALAAQLRRGGAKVAVVLLGAQGALADDGALHLQPAAPLDGPVVDTLGAGDAWIGAFLAAWLGGHALPGCLRAGAEAAARACRVPGGWPGAELPCNSGQAVQ